MINSNLKEIKRVAKSLFNAVPIEGHPEYGPIVVCHPFTESAFVQNPTKLGDFSIINLLEDKDGLVAWKKWWFERIDAATSEMRLMHYVSKAWRLTFLKYAKDYMDNDTFSELFATAWVCSENPNMDVNCSIKEMTGWFKSANKQKLMDEEEYEYWNALPEQFEVYRGVAPGRTELGLSWTRNLETAEWFTSRWNEFGDKVILKATIQKQQALAYFNGRDEDEIVVDVFAIKKNIERL